METFERARLDAYFAKIATQFAPTAQVNAHWDGRCCVMGGVGRH